MNQIAEHVHDNKRATIYESTDGYVVNYYIGTRLILKGRYFTEPEANKYAEGFVIDGDTSVQFLSE